MKPLNPIKHFGGEETTEKIQQEEAERKQAIEREQKAERDRASDRGK